MIFLKISKTGIRPVMRGYLTSFNQISSMVFYGSKPDVHKISINMPKSLMIKDKILSTCQRSYGTIFFQYVVQNHRTKSDYLKNLTSLWSQFNPNQSMQTHARYYSTSTRNKDLPIIYLFTKEECSLCDQAKEVLKPYEHRFTLEEVDITLPENEDWFEKYKYDIPVFHMYEDFLFMHRVDTDILEKALRDHEEKVGKAKE